MRFLQRCRCSQSTVRSIESVSCMLEVVSAFDWIEQIADFSDSFPDVLHCPGGDFSQIRFEFGKGHFNRIEIG